MRPLCAALLAAGLTLLARADDKPQPAAKENKQIAAATAEYEKEAAAAERAYKEALAKSKKKLLASYDAAISASIKQGGGDGLDAANRLNAEKKTLAEAEDEDGTYSPGRDRLVRLLNGRTWYWHWEQANKDRPFKVQIDAKGKDTTPKSKFRLEQRWVLTEGEHIFVPVDDNTLRGFNVGNGRQVGAFADKR